MIQLKENAQTDGRTEGQTLFYRTLLATTGSPIIKMNIDIFCKILHSEFNKATELLKQ